MAKNAVCIWDFTISKDKCTYDKIIEFCKKDCKKWCFQYEEGESGYLQCLLKVLAKSIH